MHQHSGSLNEHASEFITAPLESSGRPHPSLCPSLFMALTQIFYPSPCLCAHLLAGSPLGVQTLTAACKHIMMCDLYVMTLLGIIHLRLCEHDSFSHRCTYTHTAYLLQHFKGVKLADRYNNSAANTMCCDRADLVCLQVYPVSSCDATHTGLPKCQVMQL